MSNNDRSFQQITITRDEYRAVRLMVEPGTIAKLEKATDDRLLQIRYKLQKLLRAITPSRTSFPVLYVQYVPASEQKGKRWAYRTALESSIAKINDILTARGKNVSPLVAEEVQADAVPVQPAPAEAVSELAA